jgi:type 1 glutamine amidotransferase
LCCSPPRLRGGGGGGQGSCDPANTIRRLRSRRGQAAGGKAVGRQRSLRQARAETKLFDVEKSGCDDDHAEKLKNTKLIVFYTTGELPMSDEQFKAFDQWIKDGGAFLGIHPRPTPFTSPPPRWYNKIINGQFDGHPWIRKPW